MVQNVFLGQYQVPVSFAGRRTIVADARKAAFVARMHSWISIGSRVSENVEYSEGPLTRPQFWNGIVGSCSNVLSYHIKGMHAFTFHQFEATIIRCARGSSPPMTFESLIEGAVTGLCDEMQRYIWPN